MIKNKMLLIIIILLIAVSTSSCNESEQLTEHIEIHFHAPITSDGSPNSFFTMPDQETISNFHKLNPLITVIVDDDGIINNVYSMDEFNKLLESDRSPDIVSISSLLALKAKGSLWDLRQLQQTSGSEEIDINQEILDSAMSDGKLPILPYSATPYAVLYDKNLFDAAHIPYPQNDWTWEKFREISMKLRLNYSPIIYMPLSLDWLMAGTGKGLLSPNGDTSVGYLDSPEAIRTLQWLNGYFRDLKPSINYNHSCIGMCISLFGEDWNQPNIENKLSVAPLPHFENGKRGNRIIFEGFGISQKSKHPEAAWKFINYLTLSKNSDSFKLADRVLTTSNSIAEATGQSKDPAKSIYMDEMNYAVKSSFDINPLFNQAWNENQFNLYNKFNDLLTTEDKDIPAELHKLALAVDQEMKRLKQAEDQQTESSSP
ncbi:MAG: sugar transporter substrate-binding protein [Bacilli bacterium]|nr:sugar transporter substrate-binding protein [Bacilli bacterium]